MMSLLEQNKNLRAELEDIFQSAQVMTKFKLNLDSSYLCQKMGVKCK